MKNKIQLISEIVRGYNALCAVIKNPNYWIPESQRGPSRKNHLARVKKNKNNFNKIIGHRRIGNARLVALLVIRPMADLRRLAEIVEI